MTKNQLARAKRESSSGITQEYLKSILDYNPETGVFTWKPRPRELFKNNSAYHAWNKRVAGTSPSSKTSNRYICFRVNGETYRAHRLAWLYMTGEWPNGDIDHVNHDRTDNRFENLRSVEAAVNTKNRSRYGNNKSGITGVRWSKFHNRWKVDIGINGKPTRLGSFETLIDAAAARKAAEVKYGFHKNHGQ